MSKRHQSSRRRSYGRRQHEVNERTHHRAPMEEVHAGWRDRAATPFGDPLIRLDPRRPRLHARAAG